MESHLTDETLWAATLAMRLRLMQGDFADTPPETRQNFMTEELQRALKEIPPSKRKLHLEALADRFPAWQSALPPSPDGSVIAPAPETPDQILSRLLDAAPSLSPEARAVFSRKLQAAGFALQSPGGGTLPELPPEMLKKLGLTPGEPLSPERALKLLVGLAEMVLALDQLVWTLWKQLAPRSNYRKEAEIGKLVGPYLAGNPEVSTQLLALPLEKTRRLIAAMLGAVGRAGNTYAKKHSTQFSPDQIEGWARMEKKWNESLETVCWRKYRDQYKEHGSDPVLEGEIQEAIARAAETLIMGRGAS